MRPHTEHARVPVPVPLAFIVFLARSTSSYCPPMARDVAYIHSSALIQAADDLPSNLGRASLVHDLIEALNLLDTGDGGSESALGARARVVQSKTATRLDLERFHDPGYLGEWGGRAASSRVGAAG